MQFKHPEILFALFLLLIPIIIHLFQLRRFKKVPFTNVQFLKEVELQTRKSANLKKWLVLASRLLLFTALIFAFAQPFFSKNEDTLPVNNVIYLDNSYSMQAEGENGELFKRAIQEIIEGVSDLGNVSLYTNDEKYKNLSKNELISTLQNLSYSSVSSDLPTILLKMKNELKQKSNLFFVSDFQQGNDDKIAVDSTNNYFISQLSPVKPENISIDSLYISNQNNESIEVTVRLNNYKTDNKDISVSILNNENMLLGKSTVTFDTAEKEVSFSIPNTNEFLGKINLEDGYLNFDNTMFFTIQKPKMVKVTSVETNNTFLEKIYSSDEFEYTATALAGLDYNSINDQHLIILNGIDPSTNLQTALDRYIQQGGNLVIIPSEDPNIQLYNGLFKKLNVGEISSESLKEQLITTINFAHPLLKGVFEKEVQNFQYPFSKKQFRGSFRNASAILSLDNGTPFISQIGSQKGKIYWVSSPLNSTNSNFINSPLIVPIFYNFGIFSHQPASLYYTIGVANRIEVDVNLKKDEIVHLKSEREDYIPLQQINKERIALFTEDLPALNGFVDVMVKDKKISNLAYNYPRNEGHLVYHDAKLLFGDTKNVTHVSQVSTAFTQLADNYKSTGLWKIFIVLALIFLVVEVLLLRSKL